jgi:cytochrome c-type biogenesis protein CcmH
MKDLLTLIAALLIAAAGMANARADEAPTIAEDPALEAQVNRIGEELRCLVCQNQTITDSHAGLAVDLKNQIREQLKAGRTQQQIVDYMVERYGDFVLYRPPVKGTTLLLWVGPFALLALGAGAGVLIVRRRRGLPEASSHLTEAQRLHAAQLLQDQPEIQS